MKNVLYPLLQIVWSSNFHGLSFRLRLRGSRLPSYIAARLKDHVGNEKFRQKFGLNLAGRRTEAKRDVKKSCSVRGRDLMPLSSS